jgi:hypothetical protein
LDGASTQRLARNPVARARFAALSGARTPGTTVAIAAYMNDTKTAQAVDTTPTAKPAPGFRVQTGVRAAGEKLKYLEWKLQDVLVSS